MGLIPQQVEHRDLLLAFDPAWPIPERRRRERPDFRKRYSLGYREQAGYVIVGSFYSEAAALQRAVWFSQDADYLQNLARNMPGFGDA